MMPAAVAEHGQVPCLIVNPKSFRASRRGLAGRAAALAAAYGADLVAADRPDEIRAGLDASLRRGRRRVIVLSGDGTVQAIVDHLARLAEADRPHLLLLGGGRTNLTAADLDGTGALLDKLESVLARCRDGGDFAHTERFLLAVEQAPAPVRHGFFVAGGLIDEAIRACHRYRAAGTGMLRTGSVSTAWYLLREAALGVVGRATLVSPPLDIRAPGCGSLACPARVLIATTLAHRSGLFNPYAERGAGALRLTAACARARAFWRSLPRMAMGRFADWMLPETGYLSGRCARVEVLGMRGYALDGEEFDTDPARPVVIGTGPRIGFLLP